MFIDNYSIPANKDLIVDIYEKQDITIKYKKGNAESNG